MKTILILLSFCLVESCGQKTAGTKQLTDRIDSLEKQLAKTYKPGLGEFMSGIQNHHAKLWFAGSNQNWPLAGFEIHEIEESVDDIQTFCSDRPESRLLPMIRPAIDSVSAAVLKKDIVRFKSTYSTLTNTCNSCHEATSHAFNVVTIPATSPVPNQEFKPIK